MTSEDLRFINAMIGFCTRSSSGWPAPLAEFGYVPCGIERGITVLLEGKDRTVTVDLICASEVTHHALCVESKSATLDSDQVHRYRNMTTTNLLRLGALPPGVDPTRASHDIAYICDRANAQSLGDQFAELNARLPLIAGDNQSFEIVQGAISQSDVHRLFSDGIDVSTLDWPRHYVPFKSDSPDTDVVPSLTRALARFIIDGRNFTVEELALECVPYWRLCGPGEQHAFRHKLAELTTRAMRDDLAEYYERPGSAQLWHVVRDPLKHPNELQRLSRVASNFVDRVQKGLPFRPEQLAFESEFFGIIDDGGNDEDMDLRPDDE